MKFPGIVLNKRQGELLQLLDEILLNFSQKTNLFSRLFSKGESTGDNIYVYGDVGRGKTMIAKAFYQDIPFTKNYIHYTDFMKGVHTRLHQYKAQSRADIIQNVAKEFSSQYQFMVIDEFEIHDIGDAMIIKGLFEALLANGMNLLLTSNVKPAALYKDGLQREGFLPFISFLEKEFHIFSLDGDHDYRLDKIATDKRLFYPLNSATHKGMEIIKKEILGDHDFKQRSLSLFEREIVFSKAYQHILITDFDELCRSNLSSNDFVEIAKEFSVIIMENVPLIGREETDSAIRFINFIDNVYFHKVLLFISLADVPEKIYPEGKRAQEFKRTISRLHEINSNIYFKNSKHQ